MTKRQPRRIKKPSRNNDNSTQRILTRHKKTVVHSNDGLFFCRFCPLLVKIFCASRLQCASVWLMCKSCKKAPESRAKKICCQLNVRVYVYKYYGFMWFHFKFMSLVVQNEINGEQETGCLRLNVLNGWAFGGGGRWRRERGSVGNLA